MEKIGSMIIIDPEKFDEMAPKLIAPQFKEMQSKKFTIAPGLSGSYWLNMRSKPFASFALQEIFKSLTDAIANSKQKEQFVLTDTANSLIYAIVNIVVTYGKEVSSELTVKSLNKMFSYNITELNTIMIKVQNFLTQDLTFRNIIDNILMDHKSAILNESIPPLLLNKILRYLYFSNVDDVQSFFNDLLGRFDASNNASESILLLHILHLIIALFPGKFTKYFEPFSPILLNYLSKPMPISELARNIGLLIETEMKYSGSSYYSMLESICQKNLAFDGTIPVLFDQKCSSFTNFIYSRSTRFSDIQSCMINYIEYFLKNSLHTSKIPKVIKLVSIANSLAFDDESIEAIKTKYKIKEDLPADEVVSSSHLVPPLFPLKMCRLSLAFQLNMALLSPLADGTFMFISPMPTILEKEFISQVRERAKEIEDDSEILNQPVLLAGDDFLISNLLQGLVSAILTNQADLQKVVFTFYLIPIAQNSVNEVAYALSKIDPIYKSFIYSSLTSASQIAPTFNEESNADFSPILEKESKFSHNTWFSDPSPPNMVQLAIQQYLLFAHHSIPINVWACELTLESDPSKVILVPWITSVHVGEIFAGKTLVKPPEITGKTLLNLAFCEVLQNRSVLEKQKLKSISIWNIGGENNVRPTDDWLYCEWTKDKFVLNDDNKRAKFASKITSKLVTAVDLDCSEKATSFTAIIDQRKYGPLTRLSIKKMMNPSQQTSQMTLRFATFQTY